MGQARSGLTAQLESFTHNSTEFLRREQDLLLHGHGIPRTATDMAGRPVVVAVRSHGWEDELRGIKPFVREQRPVLIGVDRGADALVGAGHRPDVVVVTGGARRPAQRCGAAQGARRRGARRARGAAQRHRAPRADGHPAAAVRDDRHDRGRRPPAGLGARRRRSSSASACTPTLAEFLDRRRTGLASTFLTRLKVGPDLVDAAALPRLYDGAVRPRHLLGALVAGVLARRRGHQRDARSASSGSTTLAPAVSSTTTDLIDNVRGILP